VTRSINLEILGLIEVFPLHVMVFGFVCLQNDAEFNTGKMLSFALGPGLQVNTNFEDLQISQKVRVRCLLSFVFFLRHVSFVIE
jgi:hypothetical protein